ncbi:AAA family ATPase [Streptomyces sp. BBFR102]|uniref:AAA family ATPase n=1 Tax=Streptomyces sp. BBFR102 TaxID=3448171 RepID=UPI003F52CC59
MIIWLNGTFGAGKTTTAGELTTRIRDSRIFDAERVGELLGHVLGAPEGDFQDVPPWRGLVVETARQVLDHAGGTLVVPQTVLVEQYWQEIRAGLAAAGIPVHHFLLHADQDTLAHRIATDPDPGGAAGRRWRLDHLPRYQQALPWLYREAEVIDTAELPPDLVAEVAAARIWPHGEGLYR